MTFGTPDWGCDEETSKKIVAAYFEAEGNFIDTANNYGGGKTEEILGRVLKDYPREDMVVATKGFLKIRPNILGRGSSRKYIINELEVSLRRLQMDFVDILYLHGPDPITPVEETMKTLDTLICQGKVRYIGISNYPAWKFVKANGIAEAMGWDKFVVGQYLYNLIDREAEREVVPAAVDQGVGITAFSALAGGILTGKYDASADAIPEGSRLHFRAGVDGPRFWHDHGRHVVEGVAKISQETGYSMPELALGWLAAQDHVVSSIVGARSEEQIIETLKAFKKPLPEEVVAKLDEASDRYLGWLHGFGAGQKKGFVEQAEPFVSGQF